MRKSTRVPPYDRVMARTVRDGECLRFTGSQQGRGYGQVTEITPEGRRNRTTHTVVFEHHHGPVPPGKIVRHSCDNRWCVEITHLLLGTYSDNNNDMYERGRRRRGLDTTRTNCKHGHDLAIYGVWRKPRRPGHDDPCLSCRRCAADSTARYRQRRRAA